MSTLTSHDPVTMEEALRQRLFIWTTGIFSSFVFLVSVLTFIVWPDPENWRYATIGILLSLLNVGLLWLNAKRPRRLWRWIFIAFVTAAVFTADSPQELIGGRSLIVLLFPIVLASMLLDARAGALWLLVMAAGTVLLAISAAIDQFIIVWMSLAILAILILFFASSFEALIADLALINRQLDQRVAERTRDLQSAMEKLQEFDRQRSHFLSVVSHELRSPLNTMAGFLQVMQKPEAGQRYGNRSESLLSDLNRVYANSQELQRLVDEILDMAKIEAGYFQITRDRFNLSDLIAEVAADFRPQAEAKTLSFSVEDRVRVDIIGDRARLAQVLRNLLNNAAKHTSAGTIRVRTEADPDGTTATLVVSDTGEGVAPQYHSTVFEPFRQAGKSSVGGTGLGLPICKHIVEAHGGTLQLESTGRPGEGMAVYIRLPLNLPGVADSSDA
jgi:signal transduction histidine kinase